MLHHAQRYPRRQRSRHYYRIRVFARAYVEESRSDFDERIIVAR
jgi:hypothetical protein